MDNCTIDCIQLKGNYNYTQTCLVAQQLCQQNTVQFIQTYYCLANQSFFLLLIIGLSLLFFLYKAMNNLASNYLTPCVQDFIDKFKISPTFAGVTFLAFANGAPDVLTAIVAGGSDSDSTVLIPFGSIFGALLFSSTIILSTVIFILKHQLKVKKKQVLQPVIFYVIGIIYIISVSIFYQKMNWMICCGLFILYFIYIIFVVKSQRKFRKKKKSIKSSKSAQSDVMESSSNHDEKKLDDNTVPVNVNISDTIVSQTESLNSKQEQQQQQNKNIIVYAIETVHKFIFDYTIPPISPQQWTPIKAIISLLISPIIITEAQGLDTLLKSVWNIPIVLFISIPSFLFLIHTFYLIFKGKKPNNMVAYSVYSFIVSITWLTLVCSVLINIIELFQLLTGINSVFLGMTLFAWANCIGDYLSITSFAAKGHASTAIAGIFSGQLFDFLVGFGGSLLVQSLDGEHDFDIFSFKGQVFDILSDSIVVLVIIAGLIYLCIITYIVCKKDGTFGRFQALLARIFYIVLLVLAIGISITTDFFRQIECNVQL